jgi:hypothetical protein
MPGVISNLETLEDVYTITFIDLEDGGLLKTPEEGNRNIAIKKGTTPDSIDITFKENSNIDYEFRTTLVKELHSLEDIYGIKDMIKGAKKYFLQCFIDNGECLIGNLTKVEKEEAEAFKTILEKDILNVSLRSYE